MTSETGGHLSSISIPISAASPHHWAIDVRIVFQLIDFLLQ